jgi:peptidoglycan/LPS O-acetylase OafA/YrhL
VGYFDVAAELKPLLHTWSLAVEMQYYVIFPLLLMLFWKLGRKWILSSLLLMAITSVLVAHWGATKYPAFTFYSLPTRGFEILIGALISLYISRKSSIISISQYQSVSSITGLGMILYSIFVFDNNTPSPSLYSLIPTIGTGLILISANNKNLVGKLLSNKFFVGIGLISYSAYLWHHPIIAFSKLRNLFGLQLLNPFLIAGTSLVLAYLTYKFIEKPFRNKNIFSSKFILCFSLIGTLAFITMGSVIYLGNGLRNINDRVPVNIEWLSLSEKINTNGEICEPVAYEKSGISTCNFGDLNSNKNTILYGDSHAKAISEELNKMFIELKIKGTVPLLEED